jgi:glutathione synthase/RimK-type ligase-like ATP-grasp enzyme
MVELKCPHCGEAIEITKPDKWAKLKARAYLWYSDSTCDTGRKIAAALDIECGNHPPRNPADNPHVICWGNKRPSGWREQAGIHYYNEPSAIVTNRNKMAALRSFQENGVRAPRIYETANLPDRRDSYPLIGRRISHQGGEDAVICLDRTSAQRAIRDGSQFFLEYIPKDAEYRVNVFNGEIFMAYEKMLGPPETHNAMTDYVWSAGNGWLFSDENRTDVPAEAQELAIRAVEVSGLLFGAVDIIHGEDGHFYALEVNTAPSLIDRRVNLYAQKFKDCITRGE